MKSLLKKRNALVKAEASSSSPSLVVPKTLHDGNGGTIRMDKYGFLLEDDEQQCPSKDANDNGGGRKSRPKANHKWEKMLHKKGSSAPTTTPKSTATNFSNAAASKLGIGSQAKLKSYARRGLPDSIRQKAWITLTGADILLAANPGKYNQLLSAAQIEYNKMKELENNGDIANISRTGNLLETIERDIHRTFPRHYLFHSGFDTENENGYELNENHILAMNGSDNGDVPGDEDESDNGGDKNSSTSSSHKNIAQVIETKKREFSESIQNVGLGNELFECCNGGEGICNSNDGNELRIGQSEHGIEHPANSSSEAGNGQEALRNVLRAYNMYNPALGYCQGMNYIVAMFLSFLQNEEESTFWLLVVVMNYEPYKLCDLFGEHMEGTHEVLYIAEKLIQKFLPKLYEHFEKEGVHVSMFITEWLVTIYVSKFPFDLVSRVWDCFLVEGWKVVYRTMLSLLEYASKDLLELKFEGILNYFREFPRTVKGRDVMEASLKIGLKRKHMQRYGKEWRMHDNNTLNAGAGR